MRREILSSMLSLSLCLSLLPVGAAAAIDDQNTNGNLEQVDGDAHEAVEISSEDDLKALAEAVSSGDDKAGVYYKLTADIALDGEWTPIGTAAYQFKGTFDGSGHTLSGLYISSSDDYQGLFGYVGEDGVVKNITVTGSGNEDTADVTGGSYVGAIAGYSSGTVEGCTVDVNVDGGRSGQYIGGVVGYNAGTVRNCANEDTRPVSGNANIGGIAGCNYGAYALIEDCSSSGFVGSETSGLNVGGIVGQNDGGTVTNCHNYSQVENGNSYVGGIAGLNRGSSTVSYCDNSGSVSCSESDQFNKNLFLGGVVGSNGDFNDNVSYSTEDNPKVRYCSNRGAIGSYIDGGNCVGGIAGANCFGTVEYCFNLGDIGANATVAGIVGINSRANVNTCFNAGIINGVGNRIGGVVGYNRWDSTVENLYNLGSVMRSGTDSSQGSCGGIVGENNNNLSSGVSTMRSCYNIGTVSGDGRIASVAGYVGGNSPVQNCYFLDDIDKGIRTVPDGTGIGYGSGEATAKTVDEFHDQSSESGSPLVELLGGEGDVWEYSELLGRPVFRDGFLRELTLPQASGDNNPLTYTGEAQQLGNAIIPGTTVVGVMVYGTDENDISQSLDALTGTDVGSYDIRYASTLGANYNALVTPQELTVDIVKAAVDDLKGEITIYRDHAGKTGTVDLSDLEGFPEHLDIAKDEAEFAVISDQYSGLTEAETKDGILTLVTNDSSDPESDTVVIGVGGMQNYEDFNVIVEVNWRSPDVDSGNGDIPNTGDEPNTGDVPNTGDSGYGELRVTLVMLLAVVGLWLTKPFGRRYRKH